MNSFICVVYPECDQMVNKFAVFTSNANENEKDLIKKDLKNLYYICRHHFEEKYLDRNKQRAEQLMSPDPTPTIFHEDLVQNKPTVLPIIIIPPRKPQFERIFQEDELNSSAYKRFKINTLSDINETLLKYLGLHVLQTMLFSIK